MLTRVLQRNRTKRHECVHASVWREILENWHIIVEADKPQICKAD